MLSVKGGTQTWSKAEQASTLDSDKSKSMSAADEQRLLGDQSLGDYLNKVADPNWIDPAKTRKVGNSELDKDAFLKLFLAQLKNQDPMNPLQSHELAAQLAQFTSLEKLNNIDEGINKLAKVQNPKHSFEALNLIGKVVASDSSRILRSDENEQHQIEFKLVQDATEAVITIKDALGQDVRKLQANSLKQGDNRVSWDGRLENGTDARPGEYKVVIEAKNGGQKIHAQTGFEGKVTGVNYTADGPVLMIGNQSLKLSEVKKIVDTTQQAHQRPVHEVKDVKSLETGNAGEPAPVAGMGGNLESVGMSQDLINKIQQATEGGS